MKKIISVVISLILMLSVAVPAFAADGKIELQRDPRADDPIIYISGDSNTLSYDGGTKEFSIEQMLEMFTRSEDGSISEAAFNILYPFLLEGIAFNKWDNYYDAVYKEISDVFKPVMLDENGDPNTDCGIPQWQKDDKLDAVTRDRAGDNGHNDGKYGEKTYIFYYDWRLDPMVIADELHEYILGVKEATDHDKVSLSVRCLGCNIVLAYVYKYGAENLKGVGIDVATSMGAEFLSGMISGKFGVDGNSISRFIADISARSNKRSDLINFAASTVDLLTNSGALGKITDVAREQLYSKIEYGVISALARASFMTFPGYWGMVSDEDFESALNYVFGKEGDEKRETYKGLIEKVSFFNNEVKRNVYPLMKSLKENGNNVNICIVAKYGIQMAPTIKDGWLVGDEYVSANHASLGATTSTVYDTLSDEYIVSQKEKGLGRYISLDKQIDASTCLFPDNTWFFKNLAHGKYIWEEVSILMSTMDANRQLYLDDFNWSQYAVYDYDTRTCEIMNEDNCNKSYFTADDEMDHPTGKYGKLTSFLLSLFKWIENLFKLMFGNVA